MSDSRKRKYSPWHEKRKERGILQPNGSFQFLSNMDINQIQTKKIEHKEYAYDLNNKLLGEVITKGAHKMRELRARNKEKGPKKIKWNEQRKEKGILQPDGSFQFLSNMDINQIQTNKIERKEYAYDLNKNLLGEVITKGAHSKRQQRARNKEKSQKEINMSIPDKKPQEEKGTLAYPAARLQAQVSYRNSCSMIFNQLGIHHDASAFFEEMKIQNSIAINTVVAVENISKINPETTPEKAVKNLKPMIEQLTKAIDIQESIAFQLAKKFGIQNIADEKWADGLIITGQNSLSS